MVLRDLRALHRSVYPVSGSALCCAADLIRAQTLFLLKGSNEIANEFAQVLEWDRLWASDKSELLIQVDELRDEISSQTTQSALEAIHADDTLANHILRVVPADEEVCARPPERIRLRFDMHVKAVHSIQQTMKVTNLTIHANLHGEVRFDERTSSLEFTPSLALDKKCKYSVHVRAQEIETFLGRLHGTFEFGFRTS